MVREEKNTFIKIFLIFIIIQPILDILTYVSITQFKTSITIGIIARVLFMLISLLYIFLINQHPEKQKVILYLITLFVVLGFSFVFNYFTKPSFNFFSEAQFIVKTIYFPVMFSTLFLLIESSNRRKDVQQQLIRAVVIAMVILSVSLFAAILTNTANPTYTHTKFGFTGWFYAGNETSAIVAISFPIVLIYAMLKTNQWKDLIHWLPAFLLAFVALLIGTKVSFFAVFATIIIALLMNGWNAFRQKRKQGLRILLMNSLLMIGIFAIAPFSPSYQNIVGDYNHINEAKETEMKSTEENKENRVEKKTNQKDTDPFLQSALVKRILSSRNIYFEDIYVDYKEAGLVHKLFGLGYAGFYKEDPKLIEMDFFDWFFSYGVLGFVLLMLPFIALLWRVIQACFRDFLAFLRTENILLCVATGLGIGVAFLAGHVLYAPAVSIYLAIAFALLYRLNKGLLN